MISPISKIYCEATSQDLISDYIYIKLQLPKFILALTDVLYVHYCEICTRNGGIPVLHHRELCFHTACLTELFVKMHKLIA
jgi:hypothetical protein